MDLIFVALSMIALIIGGDLIFHLEPTKKLTFGFKPIFWLVYFLFIGSAFTSDNSTKKTVVGFEDYSEITYYSSPDANLPICGNTCTTPCYDPTSQQVLICYMGLPVMEKMAKNLAVGFRRTEVACPVPP